MAQAPTSPSARAFSLAGQFLTSASNPIHFNDLRISHGKHLTILKHQKLDIAGCVQRLRAAHPDALSTVATTAR
jgi:hypothetical protein